MFFTFNCNAKLYVHVNDDGIMFVFVEFAIIIKKLVGGNNPIKLTAAVEDDPQRRKPDISRAKQYLDWEPKVRNCSLSKIKKKYLVNI